MIKHTNFNLIITEDSVVPTVVTPAVTPVVPPVVTPVVNSTCYTWYFWGGYQEKFAKGDYVLVLSVYLNDIKIGNSISAEFIASPKDDVSVLKMNNFEFPGACKTSTIFKSELVVDVWTNFNNKWQIFISLKLTCELPKIIL